MPYISVNVAARLEQPQKEHIKKSMGETITVIPGKTEAVTMVRIDDDCSLYLAGRELENGAFIEIRLLGEADRADKEALTKAVYKAMADILAMPESDIYINFIEMDCWGAGGRLIAQLKN